MPVCVFSTFWKIVKMLDEHVSTSNSNKRGFLLHICKALGSGKELKNKRAF